MKGARLEFSLQQGQPFGGGRFLDTMEKMTGLRREARPRGRPRKTEVLGVPPSGSQLGLDV